jgi:hypothetical protein
MRTGYLAGLALVAAGLQVSAPAHAVGETCQGKDATLVQSSGTVNGTPGDDVIVAKGSSDVRAGAGDDTVCVNSIGRFDGGDGTDSIELVDGFSDGGGATVVDFEQLDVRTFYNLGTVSFEWTTVPTQLSGAVDASYYPQSRSAAKVLDNPTVAIEVPDESDDGLKVDLRAEQVILGEGLAFSLTGVDDIVMTAAKIRAFGNDSRNFFFLNGCDVKAHGGSGNDRLWASDRHGDRQCPGVQLFGQKGPDKLRGTKRDDVLLGGPDKDRAYGDKGKDRCLAEKKEACER